MAKFTYKAKKNPTIVIDGHVEADSEEQALHMIHEMGLSPLQVASSDGQVVSEPAGRPNKRPRNQASRSMAATGRQAKRRRHGRVRAADLNKFTRQLATLMKTNVPILRALALIGDQPGSRALSTVAAELAEDVRQGRPLSESMAQYPKIFDAMYLNMIKVGERGGVLGKTLENLAEHREKELETRRGLQAAIAYPAFVVLVAALSVFVVITLFLPRVVGIFRETEGGLPLPTEILIGISDFMSNNWYWFVIFILFIFALAGRNRRGSRQKMLIDFVTLHTPGLRGLVRNAEIARFARTLSLLTETGTSVHEALQLATETVTNDALRVKMAEAAERIVERGETLSASLSKINVFPKFAINMIAVGEEGGDLSLALEELSESYEREVAHSVRLVMALLEPAFILIVGAIVAFIVFALLLPFFSIGGLR